MRGAGEEAPFVARLLVKQGGRRARLREGPPALRAARPRPESAEYIPTEGRRETRGARGAAPRAWPARTLSLR